jgi:hypothetical protein
VVDRAEDILELATLGAGVVDVVRHDDRQVQLGGQCHRLRHEPVVVGQRVMGQLQMEAVPPVALGEDLGRRPRPRPIAHPQAPRDLALATAGQGDEPLRMSRQEGLVEPGHRLRPGEVRPRQDPTQASIAGHIPGEQDEMRSTLRLADPAPVLLDRFAVARQPRPRRARPIRLTILGGRVHGRERVARTRTSAPSAAAPDGPPGRHGHAIWVRDDRVAQLELDAEDRQEAGLFDRRLGADDAVEALVIGHPEPEEAQLGGSLGQLVGRRSTIEEREVRVAVELGVGGHPGRSMIEHLFCSVKPPAPPVPPDDGPKFTLAAMKHNRSIRRLPAVKRDRSSLLVATLRTGFMVGLAVLLILVLLPAAIAAQAAGLR